MKPVIGIWIEYGFHEVKKYIHSGFYKVISNEFDIVWFIVNKENAELDKYFSSTGFPLVYLDFKANDRPPLKIESYNLMVRKAWMRNIGINLHHYYRQPREAKIRDKLLGKGVLKLFFEKIIFQRLRRYYFSTKFENLFRKNNITNVFTTGYHSTYSKEFIYTAQVLRIKTWFLVNSWKDLFVSNFIPCKLTGLFVWSESMKQQYQYHMPYLKSDSIHVSGNPSFDYMLSSKIKYSRLHYAKKYHINCHADWLYYTMLPPGNLDNEIEIVKLIAQSLLEKYTENEKVILLRRNPNHDKTDFIDDKLPKNVILTDHYCTFDKTKDMILQSPAGEDEWFDLVNYSFLNISVPSTVTLEFLLRHKAVLNIAFGPTGGKDSRLDQYMHSEFYKPLFVRRDVQLCHSVNGLISKIGNHTALKESEEDDLVYTPKRSFSYDIVKILEGKNDI